MRNGTDTTPSRLTYLPVIGEIDGRTKAAIAFRNAVQDFVEDLGGETGISRAQLEMVRRCAGLAVLAAQHEAKIVAGQEVDAEAYLQLVNSHGRALGRLGMARAAKDITPIRSLEDLGA
jgi:hypothetical protein